MKNFIILTSLILSFLCPLTSSAYWSRLWSPTSNYLYDVYFINDNTGWICGENAFFKTYNGGASWENHTFTINDFALQAVWFIDANTGYAAGDYFYKSTNGGVNWFSTVFTAQYYKDIFFINSSTGWRTSFIVEKTTNGGNSWVQQSVLAGTGNDVFFLNPNTGWVCCGQPGNVYKTVNGGTNWTLQRAGGADEALFDINFSDANNGRMGANDSKVWFTTNGGSNWTSSTTYQAGSYNRGCLFINSSTGWVIGDGGYFTTNRGTSWSYVMGSSQMLGTCFTPSGYIFAVGSGGEITKFAEPTPPTNLTATVVSASQINLNWIFSPSADKYMIERSPNGATEWTLIDSVDGFDSSLTDVRRYYDEGLNSDQGYFYRVYAKELYFNSDYSNVASARTYMNSPALSFPANDAVYPSAVPLVWSTVTNGFFYTVQVASDSNFSNIIYTTTTTGTSATPDNLINSNRYHWRVKTSKLDGSNESQYSAYRSFWILNPNYGSNMQTGDNLYYFANSTAASNPAPSKPVYNWRDTTGSINLILNGTAMYPVYGGLDEGRFDIIEQLPPGNSVRFFGTNYRNIYIGTNGIVGFTPFNPSFLEPTSGLPMSIITNAIYPFWKDLNFYALSVPINRLCYKITANEIIVTYMRAPNHNPNDANDYVSFQVILSHSPSTPVNSNILVMYNYDQTGSTFINRYNNNNLRTYIIGLQGSNSSSQFLQYRYLDGSQQLITKGPMFGSNMALQFGPDATLLPVELASFTSLVNGSNVKLEWSTVNEQNNSGFDIERTKANENNWKKISFVQGSGTTNENKNYSYEDKNLSSGKYQYRLKQIDFNGNYEYHALQNEVEIGVPKKFSLSQNYPNPFNPNTVISYQLSVEGFVSLKVYDITGKEIVNLVNKIQKAGYYTVNFNGSNLASGMYFYQIQAGDFTAVKKMILIK
jgi:hypothetical protein